MDHKNCCCPKFNPKPWDGKEIVWDNKKFATDRVRSFFHIPLNFGQVMKRIMTKIEASNAKCQDRIVLADEDSLWGTNVYVEVTGEVKEGQMTTLSGHFYAKSLKGLIKTWANGSKK